MAEFSSGADSLSCAIAFEERSIASTWPRGPTRSATSRAATGVDGRRYLFTGDTLYRSADGSWAAGYLPGISDWDAMRASLEVLAGVEPDLVVSSAFAGESGVHEISPDGWVSCLEEARGTMAA